jgi:hypothetical protein
MLVDDVKISVERFSEVGYLVFGDHGAGASLAVTPFFVSPIK